MQIFIVKKQKEKIYESGDVFAALAAEMGFPDASLTHDGDGAPRLSGGMGISVSDTKNYWCCALTEGAVGLDIEENRSVKAVMVKRLHPLEQQYLSGLEPEGREWTEEFLTIWTRKESYMKFCGEGLRLGLSRFTVVGDDLAYCTTIECPEHPSARIRSLQLPYGITGALCTVADEEPEITEFSYAGRMRRSVLEKATELLAQRMYASGELRKKLLSCGYGAEETDFVISEFSKRGYLDDADYAERLVRKLAAEGKGAGRIRQELRQKGLSAELAASAPDVMESERERALRVAAKMTCGNEKEKARIARKLASLGYEASVIYDVIDQLKG